MPDFIHDIPQIRLAIYIGLLAVAVSFVGIVFLKPILRLLVGRAPDVNDVIAYATSGFGLFYGLLLGLLTVAAFQNREAVASSILDEAAAVGALYADMNSYPEPIRTDVREMLRDYVQFAIHRDWPAMRQGEVMNGGANRADAMRQRLSTFNPATVPQEIVHRETIGSFQKFSDFRQQRLNGVITRIPDVLWYAVLVGAVINVLLIMMLKMRPFPHFVLATISIFFLGVILFVIIALDDPLRGDTGLGAEPFELLWQRQMIWDEPLT